MPAESRTKAAHEKRPNQRLKLAGAAIPIPRGMKELRAAPAGELGDYEAAFGGRGSDCFNT
jgi:hypothetical protein